MHTDLSGKIAVVTGASKGIGLAISQALAESGAHVIAGARHTSPELQVLVEAERATFVAADLATSEGPADLVRTAAERGGLDILINNAGAVVAHPGGFTSVTDGDWQAAIALNLLSVVRTTRAAIPQLVARGGGSIVVIGSVNATLPDPPIVEYCATKAAVANLSKALSKELGPQGIRVNVVSPGPVSTPLWLDEGGIADQFAAAAGTTADAIVASVVAGAATRRFTTPEEVADLVVFLAGETSANITGADIRIDGGYVPTV